MTIDEFWKIVDEIHVASGGEMETKCDLLAECLRKRSIEEVEAFILHFYDCENRANTKALGKAHDDYFSEDGFWDFCAHLISMGRETFERLVKRPSRAACHAFRGPHGYHESFAHPMLEVHDEMTGFSA